MRKGILLLFLLPLCFPPTACFSQNILSLREMLQEAEQYYPLLKGQQYLVTAAKEQLTLAKHEWVPRLDAAAQANLATYNNITGMSYPGTFLPISGPPSEDNRYKAVPGTAASLSLVWNPITFGQRNAYIRTTESRLQEAIANSENELFQHQANVINLYLDIMNMQALIDAFEKNIERTAFNLQQISVLVIQGLRPGVDSSRFSAQLAESRVQLYQLEKSLNQQLIALSRLTGLEDDTMEIRESSFTEILPSIPSSADTIAHPLINIYQARVAASESELNQIRRSWLPRLDFWGTTYARGSGVDFNGSTEETNGLGFTRYNYGIGVNVVFPILDFSHVAIQSRQQQNLIAYETEMLNLTTLNLDKQLLTAESDLNKSLQIARQTPLQFRAANESFNALQTQYNEGLIDYADLIQGQYDLLNAEASLKNSYIEVWKGLLLYALASGDINVFLNQINN